MPISHPGGEMIDKNKPIRPADLELSKITFLFNDELPGTGVYKNDDVLEEIDEIGLETECLECGETQYYVLYPELVEDAGVFYPVIKVRRVTEK
jgi:hypothetical protein